MSWSMRSPADVICPRSARRARRSGSAAWSCRSPTAPSARRTRRCGMSRSTPCSTSTVCCRARSPWSRSGSRPARSMAPRSTCLSSAQLAPHRRRPACRRAARRTTRSPAARPLSTWRSVAAYVGPSVDRAALDLAVARTTNTTSAVALGAHRGRRHAARRGAAGGAPGRRLVALEEATRARPSRARCARPSRSIAMRTFTVALLRSAVGMIAITSPGILQSGRR